MHDFVISFIRSWQEMVMLFVFIPSFNSEVKQHAIGILLYIIMIVVISFLNVYPSAESACSLASALLELWIYELGSLLAKGTDDVFL